MKQNLKLPQMETQWHVEVVGEESKINWVGDFVYRRPNLRERAMIDVMWKRLNGDLLTIDEDTRYYNEATSHLRFTLKEYPEWWSDSDYGSNIYDANVILDLYEKALAFEAKWREKTYGGEEKDVSDEVGASEELVGEDTAPPAN